MLKFTCQTAKFLCATALAAFTATAGAQPDAAYPSKPVRIILPYAAGGSTSVATRIIAQKLTEIWGQSVIVDNRAGGNTIIGSLAVARAPADGYTLLVVSNTHVINPWLQARLPYDTFKDFAAISTLTRSEYMLAATPALPPNTLKEFVAFAKANPGKVNSPANGMGTVQHLVNELFMDASGTRMTIIPYKGGAQSTNDLMAGVVQVSFNNLVNLASHVTAGQLKGIAISGDKRSPLLPDVPTFAEAGLPGFVATNWFSLMAPAGTPKGVIQKLNADITKALGSADTRGLLAKQGLDPFPNSVAATEALLRADYERYGKIIRAKGITADTQ